MQPEDFTEETLESSYEYHGRIVNLRVDRVRMPDGRESVREVVENRGAVAIVPLISSGEVVLIRQYRKPTGQILYELPAGLLEPGETPAVC